MKDEEEGRAQEIFVLTDELNIWLARFDEKSEDNKCFVVFMSGFILFLWFFFRAAGLPNWIMYPFYLLLGVASTLTIFGVYVWQLERLFRDRFLQYLHDNKNTIDNNNPEAILKFNELYVANQAALDRFHRLNPPLRIKTIRIVLRAFGNYRNCPDIHRAAVQTLCSLVPNSGCSRGYLEAMNAILPKIGFIIDVMRQHYLDAQLQSNGILLLTHVARSDTQTASRPNYLNEGLSTLISNGGVELAIRILTKSEWAPCHHFALLHQMDPVRKSRQNLPFYDVSGANVKHPPSCLNEHRGSFYIHNESERKKILEKSVHYEMDGSLEYQACNLLCFLAECEEGRRRIVAQEGVEVVLKAIQRFPFNESLGCAARRALSLISLCPEGCVQLCRIGVASSLSAATNTEEQEPSSLLVVKNNIFLQYLGDWSRLRGTSTLKKQE